MRTDCRRRARHIRRHRRPRAQEDLSRAARPHSPRHARRARDRRCARRRQRGAACASGSATVSKRATTAWIEAAYAKLHELVRYVDGDYREPKTFAALRRALGDAAHPLHYLALPPSLFATVADELRESGCADGASVVVEKPFGRDLAIGDLAERSTASQLRGALRLSHRPLSRQGVGAEPALLPLREFVPRADLEPQLRRSRASDDGRNLRRRQPR